jgi:hypothetical protein
MSKMNVAALQQYSQSYSTTICDEFFRDNMVASGNQLLQLTTIPQVNMLVIGSVFEKWKTEAQNFRSPYFDFESDAVKSAMQTFMNTVSQQIAVKREHLEPLLTDATKNALTILLDPKEYFNDTFRSQPNFMLTAGIVSQLQKYTKFHSIIPQHIASKMAGQEFVYVNQAITWLDEVVNTLDEKPEDINAWISKFSDKLPLDVNQIAKKNQQDSALKIESTVGNEQSFFDSATNIAIVEPPKVVQEPVQAEATTEESLNDSLRPEHENLAEHLQNQPISSIPDNIPLHQKFMFTAQLFGGSMIAYEKMIADLEQAGSYDAARELVTYTYANQYGWDASSDAVSQLIEVLKRRFG